MRNNVTIGTLATRGLVGTFGTASELASHCTRYVVIVVLVIIDLRSNCHNAFSGGSRIL